jgi:hypothetical protein
MKNSFKETKYFKYLSNNLDMIEQERIEFNKKILSLLNNQTDELGLILKCHLIIEHYIDEFLINAYPTIKSWDKVRLTFNQKLELIINPQTTMGMASSSIKCLNTLRNKFSHKLAYKIKEDDYKEITQLMTIWYNAAKEPVPKGLQLIEKFTMWVCANLNSMTEGIKKQSPELGLPGYTKWLNKMTKQK